MNSPVFRIAYIFLLLFCSNSIAQSGIDLFKQAQILEEQNQTEKAIDKYEQCISINYNSEICYTSIVALLSKDNEHQRILNYSNNGLGSFPNNINLLSYRANSLIQLKRNQEAKQDLFKLISLSPPNASLFLTLGSLWEQEQNYNEAILNYEKALAIEGSLIDAYYNIGVIYFNLGQDVLKTINFKDSHSQIVEKEAERDKYSNKALNSLLKAHEIEPSNIKILNSMRTVYISLSDKEGVIEVDSKIYHLTH